MNRSRIGRMLLAVVLLVLLSGCALLKQPSALIQQPDLTKDNQQLLREISGLIPEGAHLVTPAASTLKGKIMRLTLQKGTAGQSAFFYETSNGTLYLSIMNSQGGHWHRIYNQPITAGKVVKIAWLDSGPNHESQLVMTVEHFPENLLYVYSMKQGKVVKLIETSFNGWIYGYFDNRFKIHLALIQTNPYTRRSRFIDYALGGRPSPALNIRQPVATFKQVQGLIASSKMMLAVPEIGQLNDLSDADTDVNQMRNQLRASNRALVRHHPFSLQRLSSALHAAALIPGTARFGGTNADQSSIPFYSLNPQRPTERYYNVSHHFFVDFPINTAGSLVLANETATHITFNKQNTEKSYLSIYWIPKQQWTRGTYTGWIRIGASAHQVFAIPAAYKDNASVIKFGVYSADQDE